MLVKIVLWLKNMDREALDKLSEQEECVGGWKGFIESNLDVFFAEKLRDDFDIDIKILEIEELR